jgi:hypothetical protein
MKALKPLQRASHLVPTAGRFVMVPRLAGFVVALTVVIAGARVGGQTPQASPDMQMPSASRSHPRSIVCCATTKRRGAIRRGLLNLLACEPTSRSSTTRAWRLPRLVRLRPRTNTHHLVPAALELVRHSLDRHARPQLPEIVDATVHKWRPLPTEGKMWKDPDFRRDTTANASRPSLNPRRVSTSSVRGSPKHLNSSERSSSE